MLQRFGAEVDRFNLSTGSYEARHRLGVTMRFAVYLSVCLCSFRYGIAGLRLWDQRWATSFRGTVDCHNDNKEKGDRSFESLLKDLTNLGESYVLEEIVDLLNLGDMPMKMTSCNHLQSVAKL